MEPRIETIPPKKLVGFGARMSLGEDATPELWRRLMPRRHEIANRAADDYVSLRVYRTPHPSPGELFAPATVFEKWAAVEVAGAAEVPEGMQSYTLDGGLYAVFVHAGAAAQFPDTMRYVFDTWLPASPYELDDREHFERLPEGWRTDDGNAREEIWVPVRPRRAFDTG